MTRRAFWTTTALLVTALPAAASDAVYASALHASYWGNFKEFWVGGIQKQNGVILAILAFGAVCLIIITRSKAKK